MRRRKKQVAYSREQIIEVLRTLEELVVSLDRIGSASHDTTTAEYHAALSKFIQRHKIAAKAACARRIFSEPFSTAVGPDGMDELEREMQNVRFWK
jgi:hypothetical protein